MAFADTLRDLVASHSRRLHGITDSAAAANRRGAPAWSAKQELGHLIDSATNNRVRFVRAALEGEFAGPSYDGAGWVNLGGYADAPWPDLIDLWKSLNLALAALIDRIPVPRLASGCRIADGPPVTLEFLIEDYIRHLSHHIDHIVASAT